jgi:hypothetical protein
VEDAHISVDPIIEPHVAGVVSRATRIADRELVAWADKQREVRLVRVIGQIMPQLVKVHAAEHCLLIDVGQNRDQIAISALASRGKQPVDRLVLVNGKCNLP